MEKYRSLIASKSLPRAVKFEDTYLSSKVQLDSLLSDLDFLERSSAIVALDYNVQTESIYSDIYDDLNAHLSNVDPKFRIEVISSNGILKYSNKLTVEESLEQPNQNTCPEVMASVNFVWGNPMINKTTFPVQPVYPDSVAPMVSAGYGIADRLIIYNIFLDTAENNQFVAKTWNGIKIENGFFNDGPGPLFPAIFTVRVSQNNISETPV
jgi:hypothetical protein